MKIHHPEHLMYSVVLIIGLIISMALEKPVTLVLILGIGALVNILMAFLSNEKLLRVSKALRIIK